jgi:hypothetical protein
MQMQELMHKQMHVHTHSSVKPSVTEAHIFGLSPRRPAVAHLGAADLAVLRSPRHLPAVHQPGRTVIHLTMVSLFIASETDAPMSIGQWISLLLFGRSLEGSGRRDRRGPGHVRRGATVPPSGTGRWRRRQVLAGQDPFDETTLLDDAPAEDAPPREAAAPAAAGA